jgi:hypothetical protein
MRYDDSNMDMRNFPSSGVHTPVVNTHQKKGFTCTREIYLHVICNAMSKRAEFSGLSLSASMASVVRGDCLNPRAD